MVIYENIYYGRGLLMGFSGLKIPSDFCRIQLFWRSS